MNLPGLNKTKYCGSIELVIGPMRSEKTSELERRIKRQRLAKKRCIVIKSKTDTRKCDNEIKKHDKSSFKADLQCGKKLMKIEEKVLGYDVIGIDEGQFFDDLINFCDKMANLGKLIIVAGLDGDYLREPFHNVLGLISKAKKVDKMLAVCMMCGDDAQFTMKKIKKIKSVTNDIAKRIEIGDDIYVSACRKCFGSRSKKDFY